eukprot:scaffold268395_cov33-Tisochrysis_lutea.AAC.1
MSARRPTWHRGRALGVSLWIRLGSGAHQAQRMNAAHSERPGRRRPPGRSRGAYLAPEDGQAPTVCPPRPRSEQAAVAPAGRDAGVRMRARNRESSACSARARAANHRVAAHRDGPSRSPLPGEPPPPVRAARSAERGGEARPSTLGLVRSLSVRVFLSVLL